MNTWAKAISRWIHPCLRSRLYDFYWWIYPSKHLIARKFQQRLGTTPNLSSPRTFNEKIQWLKLHGSSKLAEQCADKKRVREYVTETVGSQYLIPSYGTFDSISLKEIASLPNQFVLKGTHGSGWVILCRDKSQVDWPKQINRMHGWLHRNYYWQSREWVYKKLTPAIIAEELLIDPEWSAPMDYKIHCFQGIPRFIQVDIDRFGNHTRNFYDFDWNLLDFGLEYPRNPNINLTAPDIPLLKSLCSALSQPFPYVRVDLYWHQQHYKFGELTFFHGSGFEIFAPTHWDTIWGELIPRHDET